MYPHHRYIREPRTFIRPRHLRSHRRQCAAHRPALALYRGSLPRRAPQLSRLESPQELSRYRRAKEHKRQKNIVIKSSAQLPGLPGYRLCRLACQVIGTAAWLAKTLKITLNLAENYISFVSLMPFCTSVSKPKSHLIQIICD